MQKSTTNSPDRINYHSLMQEFVKELDQLAQIFDFCRIHFNRFRDSAQMAQSSHAKQQKQIEQPIQAGQSQLLPNASAVQVQNLLGTSIFEFVLAIDSIQLQYNCSMNQIILQSKAYKPTKILSSSSHQTTYLVSSQEGQTFLIKLVTLSIDLKEKFLEESKRLKNLQHINLVKIHQMFIDNQNQNELIGAIVMSYHPQLNLNLFLNKNGRLLYAAALIDIFMGLSYLHSKKICANLTPQNVVISHGTSKITNYFTLKNHRKPSQTESTDSLNHYLAPETIKNQQLTMASDIWSLGILLLQFLIELPEKQITSHCAPRDQFLSQSTFNRITNEGLRGVVKLMLSEQPENRPSVASVIQVLKKDQLLGQIIKQKSEGNQTVNYLYHTFERFIFKELKQSTFNKQCQFNIAILIRQARAPNAKARFLLGRCEMQGVGIKKSVQMATKRLASSLQLGQKYAAFQLYLLQTQAKEKNDLLMRSAQKEDIRGIFQLAKTLLQQKNQCQEDRKQGFQYLQKAKRQNYLQAFVYEWQTLKIHQLQQDYQHIFAFACDLKIKEAYLCYAQFSRYRECYDEALKYFLIYYQSLNQQQKLAKNGQLQCEIGDCLWLANRKTQAIQIYSKGQAQKNLKCILQLSRLLYQDKKYEEASILLEEGIKLDGKKQFQKQFYSMFAVIYQHQSEYLLSSKYGKMAAEYENENFSQVFSASTSQRSQGGVAEKKPLNVLLDIDSQAHGQKSKML